MSTQKRFTALLPDHLPDEAAFTLWECLRELTMICEEKYAQQINREYALRAAQDALGIEGAKPNIDDRQIEMPF